MQGPLISMPEQPNTPYMSTDYELDGDNLGLASSCLNCVFAEVYNGKQTGCSFGRLERFRKTTDVINVKHVYLMASEIENEERPTSLKSANEYKLCKFYETNGIDELIDVSSESVPEPVLTNEISYKIIDGRICNFYKNKESKWAKDNPESSYKDIIRKENEIRVSVIIYLTKEMSEQALINTLAELSKQTIKPIQVIVLNNNSKLNVSDILAKTEFSWRHSKCLWPEADLGLCFDDAMNYIEGSYYILMEAGEVLPVDFTERLNISLNDRLDRWVYLQNDKIVVGQTKVTKFLDGNCEIKPEGHHEFIYGIYNKLKYFAEKDNKAYMVKNLEEVV